MLAWAACAEDAGKKDAKKAVTNAPPEFAVVCSNAWVKGFTDKASVGYKAGEDITFSLSFQGVTNAIPSGKYFYKWKRTGDDGQVEEGRDPLTKNPFTHVTKSERPGFVRFSAEVVTADGRPFKKKVGKAEQRLFFEGGAGVSPEEIEGRPEAKPRDFDAWVKELRRKVAAVPFKKVERTPVAAPDLKGQTVFAVSVPCVGARPVTGYLALPDAAVKGEKLPCRVIFAGCGFAKEQPLPSKWDVSDTCVTLVTPYDAAPEAKAAEGYYPDLAAHIVRALQYLKSVPEWNGRDLIAHGSGASSQLAVMAGGLGEGVTKVVCYNVCVPAVEKYDPLFFARRIPSTCLVDLSRIGLGDDQFRPADAARLWNTLACEKKANWIQGAQAWTDQRWFKDRDVLWEKLSPVAYRDMTVERCRPVGSADHAFKDSAAALRDRIVFEAVVDPADLKLVNPTEFSHMLTYAEKDKVPITFYIRLPEKRVKDKVWADFDGPARAGEAAVVQCRRLGRRTALLGARLRQGECRARGGRQARAAGRSGVHVRRAEAVQGRAREAGEGQAHGPQTLQVHRGRAAQVRPRQPRALRRGGAPARGHASGARRAAERNHDGGARPARARLELAVGVSRRLARHGF